MNDSLKVLGLNKKELQVITALLAGHTTPLTISKEINVSRPGVYHILKRLSARGVVRRGTYTDVGTWQISAREDIERLLLESVNALSKENGDGEQVLKDSQGAVVVYRGRRAVRSVVKKLFERPKQGRMYVFQGGIPKRDWEKFFTIEETNVLNQYIKKSKLIIDALLPIGWIEEGIKEFGVSWAQNYEGRSAKTSVISPEYFTHHGWLFMFKDSVYLFALREETVIEVTNSDIQKMLFALFAAASDGAKTLDINARIRELAPKDTGGKNID